jgi:hypothetical protein
LFGRWPLRLVSRPESASPATGSAGAHKLEQADLIQRAFGNDPPASESRLARRLPKDSPSKVQ